VSVAIVRMFPVFPGYKEVIYSSPGESIPMNSGEWFAKPFTIDSDHTDFGVGVEGVLLSHNYNVDKIRIEFGYAPLSLTSFTELNDTEKRQSFWGFSSWGGWGESGIDYSSGYFPLGTVGEYVWAIRFIDEKNNSTVIETDFVITISPM